MARPSTPPLLGDESPRNPAFLYVWGKLLIALLLVVMQGPPHQAS
jgi:hypothetical protein